MHPLEFKSMKRAKGHWSGVRIAKVVWHRARVYRVAEIGNRLRDEGQLKLQPPFGVQICSVVCATKLGLSSNFFVLEILGL